MGNKGLPDKKLAGPRCVSISPRIFGPPPLFLILVLGNGESYFIFSPRIRVRFGRTKGEIRVKKGDFRGDLFF